MTDVINRVFDGLSVYAKPIESVAGKLAAGSSALVATAATGVVVAPAAAMKYVAKKLDVKLGKVFLTVGAVAAAGAFVAAQAGPVVAIAGAGALAAGGVVAGGILINNNRVPEPLAHRGPGLALGK